MGVDYTLELFNCGLPAYHGTCFLNYIRSVRTIEVTAKNTAWLIWRLRTILWFRSHNDFAEAIGLPHRNSLSICTEE